MYNGVGLPTPRGSGTSGYIQRNLGQLHVRRVDLLSNAKEAPQSGFASIQGGDSDLLEHERKREIELVLMDYAETLEEDGSLTVNEIDEMVERERERLFTEFKGSGNGKDTHKQAAEKQLKNEKIREAFGLKPDK